MPRFSLRHVRPRDKRFVDWTRFLLRVAAVLSIGSSSTDRARTCWTHCSYAPAAGLMDLQPMPRRHANRVSSRSIAVVLSVRIHS